MQPPKNAHMTVGSALMARSERAEDHMEVGISPWGSKKNGHPLRLLL
jgi:hypothetical protein